MISVVNDAFCSLFTSNNKKTTLCTSRETEIAQSLQLRSFQSSRKKKKNSFQHFASSFWLFEKENPLKENRSKYVGLKAVQISTLCSLLKTELTLLEKRPCVIVTGSKEKDREKVTNPKKQSQFLYLFVRP